MSTKMPTRDYKKEFESIIKEVIAPTFKDLGFRKSGNNFFRDLGAVGQVFNVQQSQFNFKDDKTFVFNIGLIDKEINCLIYDRELPKFPKEYDCDIRLRLGHIMIRGDSWYNLNKKTNLAKLKQQITEDINDYAIPFFEKNKNPEKWIDFFSGADEPLTTPKGKYLIIEKYGNKAMADNFWNTLYNDALVPKPEVHEIHTKSGMVIRDESEPKVNKNWVQRIEAFANEKDIVLEVKPTKSSDVKVSTSHNVKNHKNLWSSLKRWFS